jgi:hypothetical protein
MIVSRFARDSELQLAHCSLRYAFIVLANLAIGSTSAGLVLGHVMGSVHD